MTRAVASLATLLLFVTGFVSAAYAEGAAPAKKPDLAKGATIAQTVCAACHGADGNATGNAYPKLAGQHEGYLYKQLTNFKVQPGATEAQRANGVMMGMATTLSDDDMHNVAAYYASQTLKPSAAKDKALIDEGRKLFRGGAADRDVPACAGCHGPAGAGIPIQYPRLAGQWEEYTSAQLVAFRSGVRKNNEAMMTIAQRLSDDEIKSVADYIAGLR